MDTSGSASSSRNSGASTVMGLPRGAAAPPYGGGVVMMSQEDIVMMNQGENVVSTVVFRVFAPFTHDFLPMKSSFFSTTSTSTSNYIDVDFPSEEAYAASSTTLPSASPRRKLRKRQRPSDGSSSYKGSSAAPTLRGSQINTPPTSPRHNSSKSSVRGPPATPPTDVLARSHYNHTPTYVEGPSWMPPYQPTPHSSPSRPTPNPRAVSSPGENWSPGALTMASPVASPAGKPPYQQDSPSRSIVNLARRMKGSGHGQKKDFESDDSDWVCVDIVHVPVVMQRVSDMV